jgi:hypothetical protein
LRVLRGRIAWLTATAVILVLCAGFHFGAKRPGGARPLTADAGPLSAVHASFTQNQGCVACHAHHDAGLGGLIGAAFVPHDLTGACIECHTFGGRERAVHNAIFPERRDLGVTRCVMCHVEHRGRNASLTSMNDGQCHHCHRVKFETFTRGHPEFPAKFPHFARSGIQFNHVKHMNDYFSQMAYRDRAPAHCQECHPAERAERAVATAGFDRACARCHLQQIRETYLPVVALPEPATNLQALLSTDGATKLMLYLLEPTNDLRDYSGRMRQLIQGITNSSDALTTLLDRHSNRPAASNLLAGLNRDVLARPAMLWSRGEKLDAESSPSGTGWSWNLNDDFLPELRYVALGHADAVVKAWIEFGLGLESATPNSDQRQPAAAFRDAVIDSTNGVGRCFKCHTVVATGSGRNQRDVTWLHRGSRLRAHTVFSHGTHLGVANCLSCHTLNATNIFAAQFKGWDAGQTVSSFHPIRLATCAQCHAPGKVRHDCFLCHRYHESPELKRTVLTAR